MRWLIDGYNVIRRDPDLHARESESLEAGRAALVRLLAPAARGGSDDFTVVFDGARRTGGEPAGGRVQIVFSRAPQTADDVLIAQARATRDGAIVVSSDRTVGDAARRAGAAVVSAEAFVAVLTAPEALDPEEDEEDDAAPADRKRGNPRRRSREARAAERALRRLRSALTGRGGIG